MDGKSLTPQEIKLQQLQEILPEAFTEGKIDWERLQATLGKEIDLSNERYVLNWAGKSEAFRMLQKPSTKTLVPAKDESVNFDDTEHIFIEGENLEVLKVLQKSYFGKVKMIYIDPPYNTGKDSFIYPDKFSESKADYQKRVGDKDEEGYMTKEGMFRTNSKENGQYHSNWLNMMYPRLFLARNLLRDDGVIFVSIDDNELHNLKLLLNEVFGEENFVGTVVWKNATDNNPSNIAVEHEYIVTFSKSKNNLESEWKSNTSEIKSVLINIGNELTSKYSDAKELQDAYTKWFRKNKFQLGTMDRYKYIDSDGVYTGSQSVHNPGKEGYRYDIIHPITKKPCKQPLMGYRFPKETMDELLEQKKILFGKDHKKIVEIKVYAEEYADKFSSVETLDGRIGAYDLKELFPKNKKMFTNPKPLSLLKKIISFGIKKDDIVLDYFSGSGTIAHSIFELNRTENKSCKYICIQLPEPTDEKSEAYKAGYKTIGEIGKERIRRASAKIKAEIEVEVEAKEAEIQKIEMELGIEENKAKMEQLKAEIENLKRQDLGVKVLKLEESNFKQWQQLETADEEKILEQMKLFVDPVSAKATTENMAYEILLKAGKDLNSKMENKGDYITINGNELILILENATEAIIKNVIAEKPEKVIALDRIFKGNDQLKTNSVLQMKDAGIEFKTI